MAYYGNKTYLNKKDIEFLEKLEDRLHEQSVAKTKNEKDKLLISPREFQLFWEILDKIECNHDKLIKSIVKNKREKRKSDKSYGQCIYYKEYLKDKEIAKQQGIKFNKTVKDYKEMYKKEVK